jgi:Tfp pilus assembly protein PilO
MAPLKLSERERNLLIVTIGFVVFYVFYMFLLTPKWDEIGRQKDAARSLRLDLRIAEGKIKILDAIEKSVGIVPERSILSRDEKALEVLKLLSQATVRSGLTLNFIKPNLEEEGEGLKFSLSCSGRFKNLYSFFSILYRLRILLLIDSLEVLSTGGATPDLGIKINLTAYY